MPRVFVTGIGAISAIGNNVSEQLESLRNGKTGISKSKYFKSKYADIFPFGEIKLSNQEAKNKIAKKTDESFTRTDLMAFIAFEEAIRDAKIENLLSLKRTALISSSTVGGMCESDTLHKDANSLKEASNYIESYSGGSHVLKLAQSYHITGHTDTINTACSSSANAIMLGTKLIKAGKIDRAIVGGVDTLAKFTVNGFNALQILSEKACKPFDTNRNGLTLGEAGAFLVLEKEADCTNKNTYAEIAGYGNTNDAFHASSLSEDAKGIVLSIQNALDTAKLNAVDYVNTHGTATENNDQTELLGIEKTLGTIPPYNSTKSYTGHTLAAAGALEAIFSILSLTYNELYPSLQVENPIMPFNKMPILKHEKDVKINTVLSNSFGFAGNCTSLILKKCI